MVCWDLEEACESPIVAMGCCQATICTECLHQWLDASKAAGNVIPTHYGDGAHRVESTVSGRPVTKPWDSKTCPHCRKRVESLSRATDEGSGLSDRARRSAARRSAVWR